VSKYVLIESRDPWESSDSTRFYELASDLSGRGHDVVLFLVQNGVLGVRKGSSFTLVQRAIDAKVMVLLDDFSLRERGIDDGERTSGTAVTTIDALVDLLAEGRKAMWH
jgi:sulfur transfer complex TusBCD TusB component (DsrH family)